MLIALTAPKQSGKDTLADYLVEKYGYTKVAFAKPLKDLLHNMFLFTDEQLYGHLKEVPDQRWYGCTPRTAMQFVGTELIRNQLDKIMPGIGQDYFVNYLKNWYEQELALNPNIKVVISDLRNFDNEINMVKSLNGIIINIVRTNLNQNDNHQSETLVRDVDLTIFNDDLNDFYKKIDDLMLKLN